MPAAHGWPHGWNIREFPCCCWDAFVLWILFLFLLQCLLPSTLLWCQESDHWRGQQTFGRSEWVGMHPTILCLFKVVTGALLYLDSTARDTIWAFYAFVFVAPLGFCLVQTQLAFGDRGAVWNWGDTFGTLPSPLPGDFLEVCHLFVCVSVWSLCVGPNLSFPSFQLHPPDYLRSHLQLYCFRPKASLAPSSWKWFTLTGDLQRWEGFTPYHGGMGCWGSLWQEIK